MTSWQKITGLAMTGIIAVTITATVWAAPASAPEAAKAVAAVRNPDWAVPMQAPGLANLNKISDQLYRCAQPATEEGFKSIEKLGIRTVLNLRAAHDDKDEAKGTALRLEQVEINTWNISEDEVVQALFILSKAENGPFMIHCQHGADRTGLICAMHRIVNQGWTKEKAIDELKNGGYGFHAVWKNIPKFIEKADVEKIKKAIQAKNPGQAK
jgi:protein tyrosine/serine phosphatase